jgi:hypothetical protein
VLSGLIMMGPVTEGNDLVVTVYRANGSVMTTGTVNSDGTFSINITEEYTGALLVRVSDGDASTPDYIDETTRKPKDLDVDLRAATHIAGAGEYKISINMLTELAVRELGLVGGKDGAAAFDLSVVSSTTADELNAAIDTANNNVA